MLAGALVAAHHALDVLLAVDLGAAVAALRVGAVRLGAGRGAAAAHRLALDGGEHFLAAMALDQGQHVGAVSLDAGIAGVMAGGGSSVGAGQAGEVLLDVVMAAGALVEARKVLLDHGRLLAGHAAGCGATAGGGYTGTGRTTSYGGSGAGQRTAGSGGGSVQVAAQVGRLVPGCVRRDAQAHRAGEAYVEGRELRAGLGAGVEEAGSSGRGGAHDAATVHAQGVVRNNFGGWVGTRGVIAGIHFVRTRTARDLFTGICFFFFCILSPWLRVGYLGSGSNSLIYFQIFLFQKYFGFFLFFY